MRLVSLLLLSLPAFVFAQTRTIPLSELRDRIAGGWAGQMIGVSYGAPTEFRYLERIIPQDKLPKWSPGKVSNALNQDDLYVDMTFAEVLDAKGLDATTEDFGAMFRNVKYSLWHANLAAHRALRRGVPAALSGTPKYNVHANDIDFQIESDFIGLMTPGMPMAGERIAWRAGRVMNYGDGIYGGIFVSCMYSAAFFERDPRKVVEAGYACLPRQSPYAQLIADVLQLHTQHPSDWEKAWHAIETKWNRREPCPEGALIPFNIDAKLNGAYIALGLLWGGADFGKTIEISTRAGQDSDCNPSSAAGILGVMLGYSRIPDHWKGGIPALENEKFRYTSFTFKTITESTLKRAIAVAERNGGKLQGDRLAIVTQRPVAAKLELWDDYGSPVERVPVTDARWRWTGTWAGVKDTKVSETRGNAVEISFEGTGFILAGPYLTAGGYARLFVDGKDEGLLDVYPDMADDRTNESVAHRFGLTPGKHTVRLVVEGRPYEGSKGSKIGVSSLVVFR